MTDYSNDIANIAESHGPFVRKLSHVIDLTNAELSCLEAIHADTENIAAGTKIFSEGDDIGRTMIIQSGWASRNKTLSDGRRQILSFLIAGDLVGLYASVIPQADHSVVAITDLAVNAFDPVEILDVFAQCPRLGAAIGWTAARHDAILSEQITRIGRRSAYERTGHLLLELLKRLKAVGRASESSFVLPVTQEILADTLGLSIVHVNRTLRLLRQDGLLKVVGQTIIIEDYDKLSSVAEFSPSYLNTEDLPEATQRQLSQL